MCLSAHCPHPFGPVPPRHAANEIIKATVRMGGRGGSAVDTVVVAGVHTSDVCWKCVCRRCTLCAFSDWSSLNRKNGQIADFSRGWSSRRTHGDAAQRRWLNRRLSRVLFLELRLLSLPLFLFALLLLLLLLRVQSTSTERFLCDNRANIIRVTSNVDVPSCWVCSVHILLV